MKKVFLIVVGIFAFQVASAQDGTGNSYKPTEGTVTTEVSLVGGLNNANFNLNGGALKFRYFLKEDLALRASLGIASQKDEVVTGINPNETTTTDKSSSTTFKAGIEKHFAGTNRLSTYAGADLIIGMNKETNEVSIQTGDYNNLEQKSSGFGIGLFTGADYYIAPKVFLGVEAGLSFLSNKVKDAEYTSRTGIVTTSTSTPGSKGSEITTGVFGGIRIGFQF
ncbi:hypothetical protein HNQ02_002227 [Flavobacterium sp. 7E]|uniref:hypothetical protein n=1 Tax=Flavobacterium sp. 7E TaxID=2735898 RepID=UPI00156E6132|nr:hypothetical protein [Flavobacterium sp. 7E]NRS89301.1 hypothetical protein [Flavobacterium sp. 7E]